jgi:hypothetical protein
MHGDEWLQNLKVGDKVIEDRDFNGKSICTVVRFTNTQIVIKDSKGFESKYRKDNGFAVGSDIWSRNLIREATPEALAAFEEERYRQIFQNKLNKLSWVDVPLDKIKEIREIIEPYVKKQEKTNAQII